MALHVACLRRKLPSAALLLLALLALSRHASAEHDDDAHAVHDDRPGGSEESAPLGPGVSALTAFFAIVGVAGGYTAVRASNLVSAVAKGLAARGHVVTARVTGHNVRVSQSGQGGSTTTYAITVDYQTTGADGKAPVGVSGKELDVLKTTYDRAVAQSTVQLLVDPELPRLALVDDEVKGGHFKFTCCKAGLIVCFFGVFAVVGIAGTVGVIAGNDQPDAAAAIGGGTFVVGVLLCILAGIRCTSWRLNAMHSGADAGVITAVDAAGNA